MSVGGLVLARQELLRLDILVLTYFEVLVLTY